MFYNHAKIRSKLYSLYPLSSDYKSRLSCMSSCFSLYSPLAPHHNLARYCIQASCPDPALQQQPMHQVRRLTRAEQLSKRFQLL